MITPENNTPVSTEDRLAALMTALYHARREARSIEYDLYAMRDNPEFWAKYQPIHKMLLAASGELDTALRAMLDMNSRQ